jgi:hypothetical protein
MHEFVYNVMYMWRITVKHVDPRPKMRNVSKQLGAHN